MVISSAAKNSKSARSAFIGSREVDDASTKNYPALKKLQTLYPDGSIRLSSNSLCAHKAMVLSGLGVAILPENMVNDEIANGTLTSLLPEEDFIFQMNPITRAQAPLSDPSARFISIFNSTLDKAETNSI